MSWVEEETKDDHSIQGSDAWMKFRGKHLGASEVPAILGNDDWKKPIDVFNTKVFGEKWEGNYATMRGKTLEPIIREKVEGIFGLTLDQPVLEYPDWTVLSASLDGYDQKTGTIFEFKAPSIVKHTGALCGVIPDTYLDQLQTQLLVFGGTKAYYVSYHPGEPEGHDLAIVEVRPEFHRQEYILERAKRFWAMVENGAYDPKFDSEVIPSKTEILFLSSPSTFEKAPRKSRSRKQSTPAESSSQETPFD